MTGKRWLLTLLLVLSLMSGAAWFLQQWWLAPRIEGAPQFVLEHAIEFPGTPEQAWEVLMDASKLAEWNPYLLGLSGEVSVGGEIEIEILQENWDEAWRLKQRVVALDPPRLFHWRGRLTPAGLMQTDHSFHIEAIGKGRVRFLHREEFRGLFAEWMDDETREYTRRAFQAMDEALAARVESLPERRVP